MTAIERPSDEVVIGVIRAWKDWNSIRVYRRCEDEVYYECDDTPQGTPSLYDPRDDTDSALELLWHLDDTSSFELVPGIRGGQNGWSVRDWKKRDQTAMPFLPISGQPFRYAVINLAAKVMETL